MEQPRKFFCHFHGTDLDHTTNHCPEKKKTLERMEAEKKAKLVGHTSWPGPTNQTYNPPQPNQTYNPVVLFNTSFQPTPAFSYNPYPPNWQLSQPNIQRAPPTNIEPQSSRRAFAPTTRATTKTRTTKPSTKPMQCSTNLRHDHAHLRRFIS